MIEVQVGEQQQINIMWSAVYGNRVDVDHFVAANLNAAFCESVGISSSTRCSNIRILLFC